MALKQDGPPTSVVVGPPGIVSTPVLDFYVSPEPSVRPAPLLWGGPQAGTDGRVSGGAPFVGVPVTPYGGSCAAVTVPLDVASPLTVVAPPVRLMLPLARTLPWLLAVPAE